MNFAGTGWIARMCRALKVCLARHGKQATFTASFWGSRGETLFCITVGKSGCNLYLHGITQCVLFLCVSIFIGQVASQNKQKQVNKGL